MASDLIHAISTSKKPSSENAAALLDLLRARHVPEEEPLAVTLESFVGCQSDAELADGDLKASAVYTDAKENRAEATRLWRKVLALAVPMDAPDVGGAVTKLGGGAC